MNIPYDIKCPDCCGEGQHYEGDDIVQCERCVGEGRIIIAEFAEDANMSLEEAYQYIRQDDNCDEEE